MKKSLVTGAAAALAIVASPVLAGGEVEPKNSVYAGVAVADTMLSDNNYAVKLGYNRKLDSLFPGFSVDVELTKSVFDESTKDDTDVQLLPATNDTATPNDEISYLSFGSFARYDYSLDQLIPGAGVYSRVGAAYKDVDYAGTSDDSFELTYGGGLSYEVTKGLAVFADYTYLDGDIDFKEATLGIKATF